jgi:ribose transport system substrate-binding protein
MSLRTFPVVSAFVLCLLLSTSCANEGGDPQDQNAGSPATTASGGDEIQIAFLTNNASEFWKIAEAGVLQAEEENPSVSCEVLIPANATPAEQKTHVEEVIARGFDGIAISVIDPKSQSGLINEAIQRGLKVITQDSDAPESERIAFLGTNNYKAGVEAGKALMEAIPDGGRVWLFVGKADAQNAIDRRRGLEDTIEGSDIEIVDLRTDDALRDRAKANAEDVIAANSDVAALVGLWAYNGPAILEAVKAANKLGEIQIVAFDEEDATLQGVADGHIHATVVQQPYQFGYESVRVLKALVEGDTGGVPADGIIEIPTRVIKKGNVAEFRSQLLELLAK